MECFVALEDAARLHIVSAMVIAAGYGLRLSADILEVLVTRAGPSGCLPASAIDVGRQSSRLVP